MWLVDDHGIPTAKLTNAAAARVDRNALHGRGLSNGVEAEREDCRPVASGRYGQSPGVV